jgi:flagellar hook protein FlgE
MASTTAMFTGLTGLIANARNLDVIGNNIANVNTTAFKSSRMMFATQFSRTLSGGTQPGANSGGTNPSQIGLGVTIAGTQRNFTSGSISPTGDPRDLAIDGNGFFVVKRGTSTLYTRAGNFRPNAYNELVVGGTGERLQGYSVDSSFNIVKGTLTDLTIPLGTLTVAEQTRSVSLSGNLNASGKLPTRGSSTMFSALSLLPTASPAPAPGNVIEPTSRLVDIDSPTAPGTAMFTAGQMLELSGAKKGTTDVPAKTLDITSATTVQDLMDFYAGTLSIDTTVGTNPDGSTPGVTIDSTTGILSIIGNIGTVNSIAIDSADVSLKSGGTTIGTPFTVTSNTAGDGESVKTPLTVYDSLGNPVQVNVSLVLESTPGGSGTVWRYFVDSPDNKGPTPVVGTGTVSFGPTGRIISSPTVGLTVDRTGTGAITPLQFDLNFAGSTGGVTGFGDQASTLASLAQDGAPIGTLNSFGIGQDGTITGGFTNGLTRTLGQVAIATFSNAEGLLESGGNMYTPSANSGNPLIGEPLELGAGKLVAGALELANVDLSQEFINMILASTGYSAASRVITTTDQLVQQLLTIGR